MRRVKKLINDFFSSQQIQVALLILILLVVSFPYLIKVSNKVSESLNEEIASQRRKIAQWKAEKDNQKRKELLDKYGISSIYVNGEINEEVLMFLGAYGDLKYKWRGYDCKNPPSPTPSSYSGGYKSSYYEIGKTSYLERLAPEARQFITPTPTPMSEFSLLCNKILNNQNAIDKFEADTPKIIKLIRENNKSKDNFIRDFTSKIQENFSLYQRAERDAGYNE